jgi:hypothetical protein
VIGPAKNSEKRNTLMDIRKRLEAFLKREKVKKAALEQRRDERSGRLNKARKVMKKKGISVLVKLKEDFPGEDTLIDVDWDGKGAFINIRRPEMSDIFYRVWMDMMYDEIVIRSKMDYGSTSGIETIVFRGPFEEFMDKEKQILEDFMEKYEGFLNKCT